MKTHYWLGSVSVSTVASMAMGGVAGAADMPVKSNPVFVAPSWSGFYLGINGGVVSHRSVTKDLNNWADEGYVASNTLKKTGGTFGGQVGFNWQEDAFVWGIEADGNWVRARAFDTITMCNGCNGGLGGTGGGSAQIRSEMDWLATFRGRAGVTIGTAAPTLVYVTGGLAVAGINNRWGAGYRAGAPASRVSDSHFVSDKATWGWTVGFGMEHKIRGSNWSFKAEALYVDFENKSANNPGPSAFNGVTQNFRTDFLNEAIVGRVGLNYKLN